MFEQLIGKTIQKSEYKEVKYYEEYEYHYANAEWIYFTDGTGIVVYSTIKKSPSRHWPDEAEQCMEWMDNVCQRCGAINPDQYEYCFMGAEIKNGGTEPHIFLTKNHTMICPICKSPIIENEKSAEAFHCEDTHHMFIIQLDMCEEDGVAKRQWVMYGNIDGKALDDEYWFDTLEGAIRFSKLNDFGKGEE